MFRSSPQVLRAVLVSLLFSVLRPWSAAAQFYEEFANLPGTAPSSLTLASDGNFYGEEMSFAGPCGNVFRIDPAGNVVTLHSFTNGDDGCLNFPVAPLTEWNGYLYGTTNYSGEYLLGSVFRMDFLGNLQTVATLDLNGGEEPALTPAFGYLYGNGFRLDGLGNVTSVTMPEIVGEMTLASDGNLYGLSYYDQVFRLDGSENVTFLHLFSGPDGLKPEGPLLESGGYLYGTTENGGAFGFGTVFRIDFAGNFVSLHSFAGGLGDGSSPFHSSAVRSGNFLYGTTQSGGAFDPSNSGGGTIFQLDLSGNAFVVHNFGDTGEGTVPEYRLAAVGNRVYGVTLGSLDDQSQPAGAIAFVFARTPVVLKLTPTAGPVRVRPGDPVQIHGGMFPVGEVPSVLIGGLAASNVQLLDQENIIAATPPDLSPGTLNEIIIVLPDGTQASLDKAWMADFLDVPQTDRLRPYVERVFRAGLMDGCGGGNFCEGDPVDRSAMVVMALKAKHGPAWAPPECTGTFRDVPCPGPEADWIEDAVTEGIAQPCARNKFCPSTGLTRETIPDLLLKTEHGADYVPPSCAGIFKDVKCPGPHANAIEQVYNEGVVEACSTNPLSYCPKRRANRGPVAEYEARAYRLP
jgi:uncharacterized repeat protein (TIGR03803 family)